MGSGDRRAAAGLDGGGDAAARLYRESIERLARTALRIDLARGLLLFGEWPRRTGHRVDARKHLRKIFTKLGIHLRRQLRDVALALGSA